MATSIDKSVNWRKTVVSPEYKVTAQTVDTFVRGETNPKGMQVARALESAAGTLSNFSGEMSRRQSAIERQISAEEKARLAQEEARDKMRADNLSASWKEQIKIDLENADLLEYRDDKGVLQPHTQQTWFEQWKQANPTFQQGIEGLTTESGRLKFGVEIGDVLGTNFDIFQNTQQQNQDAQLISNNILAKSQAAGVREYSSSSPEWANFVRNMEESMGTFGYNSNQSRYEMLGNSAKEIYSKTGDQRMYEWLLGEVAGRPAIGGSEFQEKLRTERNQIANAFASKKNQEAKDAEARRKLNTAQLAIDAKDLFGSDTKPTREAVTELMSKYIEMGVPNAATLVTTMETAYDKAKNIKLSNSDKVELWQGYSRLSGSEAKLDYINKNADRIDNQLLGTFLSQVGSNNDTQLLNDPTYKVYSKAVKNMASKDGGLAGLIEDPDKDYLNINFQLYYLEMSSMPEWQEMSRTEKDKAVLGLFQDIKALELKNEGVENANFQDQTSQMQELRLLRQLNEKL